MKFPNGRLLFIPLGVTPLAGVWIEIHGRCDEKKIEDVTPLAGVWIEIWDENGLPTEYEGHSPRGSVD